MNTIVPSEQTVTLFVKFRNGEVVSDYAEAVIVPRSALHSTTDLANVLSKSLTDR
jgi:hypothetical protein